MTEPTRAQQEQVARDLLGRRSEPHGQDIHGKPTFQQWHASGCTAESCGVRYGPCSHALPAWNSPDFLWPLCETLEARGITFMYLSGADSWVAQGGDLDLDRPTKREAVWAAALAVIGEG